MKITNMSEHNFAKDLEKALSESLSLFLGLKELKAEQKLVIERVVQKKRCICSVTNWTRQELNLPDAASRLQISPCFGTQIS